MRRLSTCLLLITLALPVFGQAKDPNNARGFEPGKLYNFFDLDSVNTFNGNLNVRIPLGQSYVVRPGFEYRFYLTYNSKVWDYQYTDGDGRTAVPEADSNAGLGWVLTLGKVLPKEMERSWTYVTADGGQHEFVGSGNYWFTIDGSHLRMTIEPADATPATLTNLVIETGDGLTHTFDPDTLELSRIEDPYGNWVVVWPTATGWSVSDGYGTAVTRTHSVTMEVAPANLYVQDNFRKRVKKVALAAFNGATATYSMAYDDTSIAPGGCGSSDVWTPIAFNVPLLNRITVPGDDTPADFDDDPFFEPSYNLDNVSALCSSGTLKELVLPTRGSIAWGNGAYKMPRQVCVIDPNNTTGGVWYDFYSGVSSRTLKSHDGTVLEKRIFDQSLLNSGTGTINCDGDSQDNAPLPPKVARVRATTYDGTSVSHHVDHYFSAYRAESHTPVPADARLDEYGLPFTRTEALDGLYLSTRVRSSSDTAIRSTYLTYEHDGFDGDRAWNARPSRSRTVFHDDDGDPDLVKEVDTTNKRCKDAAGAVADCWVHNERTGYDGLGHYRTEETSSNYPGQAQNGAGKRTVYTNYNPSGQPLNTEPWLISMYTGSSVQEGGITRQTSTHFDEDKGVIEWVRTGNGGAGTLVAATCRDARGYVASERWLGGASLSLPADPCSATRRKGEYVLVHAFDFSDPAVITHTATWSGTTPDIDNVVQLPELDLTNKVLEETIDRNTGLPLSTRDGAGLETTYAFDVAGRLSSVDGPGVVPTTYEWTPASGAGGTFTPAKVAVASESATVANGKIAREYQYDSVGRLWREKTLMADDTWSVRETLYDFAGRTASVSELEKLPATGSEWDFHPIHTTRYSSYDVFDRPGTITAPDGKEATVTYRGTRSVTRAFPVASGSTEQVFRTTEKRDAHGRLQRVIEAEGTWAPLETSYGYDPSGNLTSVSMAGQTRTFSYDGRGLLLSETHPESGTTTWSDFDARGQARRKQTTTADLTTVLDDAGRVVDIKRTANGSLIKQYRYDATNGRLIATARFNDLPGIGTVSVSEGIQYEESNGRVRQRDQAISSAGTLFGPRAFAHTQLYNDLGLVHAVGYPWDKDATGLRPAILEVYKNGWLKTVTGWAALTYHPNGTIATVTHNGDVTERWTADASGMSRPGAITVEQGPVEPKTQLWSSGAYTYDGAGNIASIGTTKYAYDGYGRLVAWMRPTGVDASQTVSVLYDGWGNRLGSQVSECSRPNGKWSCSTPAMVVRPVDETTNRYADATYDGVGNVLADGGRTFTWDAMNMPTSVTANGRTFYYVYNVDDERIAASELLGNGTGQTTWTLRGFGDELLSVWTGTTWKEDYAWRGRALVGYNTPSGKRHYSLDHLGSPRVVTSNTGGLLGTQSFEPFGAGGTTGSGALQFTGHERDRAALGGGTVNLPDYVHARLLDTDGGRFLSVDPNLDVKKAMRNPQTWNRYAYVRNNPINFIDPDGRDDLFVGEDFNEPFGLRTRATIDGGAVLKELLYADQLKEAFSGFGSAPVNERLMASMIGVIALADIGSNALSPGKGAATKGGAIMLGHFPEYVAAGARIGARTFNVPTAIWNKMDDAARWAANQKFLDRAIGRGATLLLATDPSKIRAGSFLSREVKYLQSLGYKLVQEGDHWKFVK